MNKYTKKQHDHRIVLICRREVMNMCSDLYLQAHNSCVRQEIP